MTDSGDASAAAPDVGPAPFPDPPPSATTTPTALHPRSPRRGDLTTTWRAVTAGVWIGVILALASVWNASVQLGLSTWWLGPRADPQPRYVQFGPFVAPVLMLLGAINQARWLGWFGLAASMIVGAIGVGDLGRVPTLATVELVIAGAAAVVSLASLSGTYRRRPTPVEPTPDA